MKSDPTLRRWYLDFNRKYFDGSLPLEVVLYWAPLGPASGVTRGPLGSTNLEIVLDPSLQISRKFSKLVLLHECAHVKLWPYRCTPHGRNFDREMERLLSYRAIRRLI